MYRILLMAALVAAGRAEARGQPSRLLPFDLRDQFGRRYTEQTFRGVPIVLVGCDRGGSAFGDAWEGALATRIRAHRWTVTPQVISVADLRGVPHALRRFVKRKFPGAPADWSLLDWNGDFARAFAFGADECTILLFGESGRLLRRESGREPAPARVEALVRQLAQGVGHAASGNLRSHDAAR